MSEQLSDAERVGACKAIAKLLDVAEQCANLAEKFGEGTAMRRATLTRAELYQDAADILADHFGLRARGNQEARRA